MNPASISSRKFQHGSPSHIPSKPSQNGSSSNQISEKSLAIQKLLSDAFFLGLWKGNPPSRELLEKLDIRFIQKNLLSFLEQKYHNTTKKYSSGLYWEVLQEVFAMAMNELSLEELSTFHQAIVDLQQEEVIAMVDTGMLSFKHITDYKAFQASTIERLGGTYVVSQELFLNALNKNLMPKEIAIGFSGLTFPLKQGEELCLPENIYVLRSEIEGNGKLIVKGKTYNGPCKINEAGGNWLG